MVYAYIILKFLNIFDFKFTFKRHDRLERHENIILLQKIKILSYA